MLPNQQIDQKNLENQHQFKPSGDEDYSVIEDTESNGLELNTLQFNKMKNGVSYPTCNEGIDTENEKQIVKQLLIEQEIIKNNEQRRVWKIDKKYLLPLFIFSNDYKQPTNAYAHQSSVQSEQLIQKKEAQFNIFSNMKSQPSNHSNPNVDEQEGGNDKFKINLQKLKSLTTTNHQSVNQDTQKKNDLSKFAEAENEQKNTKKIQNLTNEQIYLNINEEVFENNGNQYQSPNIELVQQMHEREISDIKVVGSIYMMLICMLTKFGFSNQAQELYFRFQREIMVVESSEQMFDVDLYLYIETNLSSIIYLNELIILSLRVVEYIPLLNLFLITFQVRIHKVRKQIISAMVKKSLSTLEILIANYKKRIPKMKCKRQNGNQKIKNAMDSITTYYMKNGSINNEHDLLLFLINEGFQQTSVEILMFYIYNKFFPPELFITKKVIKQSLLELNIPLFAKAFRFRSKYVKGIFLTEKFFLHICSLIRCNETFAEGLYFMKKISQKKQRSSAPLWYTENVIELFEEVKQVQYLQKTKESNFTL